MRIRFKVLISLLMAYLLSPLTLQVLQAHTSCLRVRGFGVLRPIFFINGYKGLRMQVGSGGFT